ncbi:hypothetical protein [Rhizobium sp. RCC_161_2]|uniref:hypothetical protein n=1 Tax=Rhizobium sp. RCC_161_2 TaxID=3239219 RepID=UPI00352559B9
MTGGLGYNPVEPIPSPSFSKSNVDIFSTHLAASVADVGNGIKTHNAVLKGNCGWAIDPVQWAERAIASKVIAAQNDRIAQALQDAGEDVILKGGLTLISAVTNLTVEQRIYRAVRFLPVVAARDRRPLVNGLKLFMTEHRSSKYFRYAVMTCNELVAVFGDIRVAIQQLSRRISKWSHKVHKKYGIKVLYRGIEFTRATATERDAAAAERGQASELSKAFGAETALYHVHANVLYWPTRLVKPDEWTAFLHDTHDAMDAEWKDNGTVKKVEEIVKYCSKPADTLKATNDELVWLYQQTKRLKICQPLGDFKLWLKRLADRREKVVRVRVGHGSGELMRVKKGKRGGASDDDDGDKAKDVVEESDRDKPVNETPVPVLAKQERESSDPPANIVIGLSLPQWRHTPWSEPMIMVQNYDANKLSDEDGYYIREWQREAREWWNDAGAPLPEDALEVARVALEAVQSGADMSSDDICEAAQVARYIVHTCSPTVPDIESELDSIPYIQPHEAVFEEKKPPRPPSIGEINEGPNAMERLNMIAHEADQRRSMAERRLHGLPKPKEAEARQTFEQDFPTGKSVVMALMAGAASAPPVDPDLAALLSDIDKLTQLQAAA